jgi:hypothetical protein
VDVEVSDTEENEEIFARIEDRDLIIFPGFPIKTQKV